MSESTDDETSDETNPSRIVSLPLRPLRKPKGPTCTAPIPSGPESEVSRLSSMISSRDREVSELKRKVSELQRQMSEVLLREINPNPSSIGSICSESTESPDSSESEDSSIIEPMPKPSGKVIPTPTGDNPQKRKRDTATEEEEEHPENTLTAKRIQTDQHSIPKQCGGVILSPTGGSPEKRKRDTATEETEHPENVPPAKRAQTDQQSILKPSGKVIPTPTGSNPQKCKRDTATEETEHPENAPPAKRIQTDQHSILKQSRGITLLPTGSNPQKCKRDTATEETEPLENGPPAKRAQTDQQPIQTPLQTLYSINERQGSSSPLKTPSRAEDMKWPSTPEREPSTLPKSSTPGLPRPRIELDKDIPSPSKKSKKAKPPKRPHSLRTHGEALLFTLERLDEKHRDRLVQLVIARPQIKVTCSAQRLCGYHGRQTPAVPEIHERYSIKINWPQIGLGRPADIYHVTCWDKMIKTEELLPKKLFPKMVETKPGDFHDVGLMVRQWLKHSGKVRPRVMARMLDKIKTSVEPFADVAECWRLIRSDRLGHLSEQTCSLSDIIRARDTYVESDGSVIE